MGNSNRPSGTRLTEGRPDGVIVFALISIGDTPLTLSRQKLGIFSLLLSTKHKLSFLIISCDFIFILACCVFICASYYFLFALCMSLLLLCFVIFTQSVILVLLPRISLSFKVKLHSCRCAPCVCVEVLHYNALKSLRVEDLCALASDCHKFIFPHFLGSLYPILPFLCFLH